MIDRDSSFLPPGPALRFSVRDWHAWAPDRETKRAWLSWARPDAAHDASDAPLPSLPMMLRRRVTGIGQKALGAALACQSVADARYVLASRHGEFDRTILILSSLAAGEVPSPAEFSMSVHHGLAGLLSIHTGNRQGHTAVAGALDSFGYGLIEAASCLAEQPDRPVLLIYFDAPLPDAYAPFRIEAERDLPIALALTLAAADEASPDGALTVSCDAPTGDVSPECLALSFLRFLLDGTKTQSAAGGMKMWRWHRA
ncbi:beta-ketoacyl synthase chain length factor [Dongia sp.]|uniref:beta-ketoacyl synthase chain length factor n=1 Tax=Dongia sp. TaxID=1977262 RepID=UPI0035B1B206